MKSSLKIIKNIKCFITKLFKYIKEHFIDFLY